MGFIFAEHGKLIRREQPPAHSECLLHRRRELTPAAVAALHRAFYAWLDTGFSPGPVLPERIWLHDEGALAFHFEADRQPNRQPPVQLAPDLAAWLLLLDKWMDTYLVIANAREVFSVAQLAGALSFLSAAYLPPELLRSATNQCETVATAVALAVADGPLRTLER